MLRQVIMAAEDNPTGLLSRQPLIQNADARPRNGQWNQLRQPPRPGQHFGRSRVRSRLSGHIRIEPISMIDHDHVSIAVIIPARIHDHARICGVDSLAFIAGKIESAMIGFF